jgi:DNA transformation protein
MHINPFVQHVLDLLIDYDPVRARRMFGGHGIYHGDLMFVLVANKSIYIKTDDLTRPDFIACELAPFSSDCTGGNQPALSYYAVPKEAYDDREVMRIWAKKGYEAAKRDAEVQRWKRRKSD